MKRLHIKFVLLVFITFGMASCAKPSLECNDPLGCVSVRPNEPIQLAYLLPITGDAAVIGTDIVRGVELGLDNINNEILGHAIVLQGFDSECREATAERAAGRVVSEPAFVAVIGPGCSDVASEIVPIISAAGGVMISPSATAVNLIRTNSETVSFFRTIPDQTQQAIFAANYAIEKLDAETAVILYSPTSYSQALQTAFSTAFEQAGGTVLAQSNRTSAAETFNSTLDELLNLQPDILYLPMFAPESNHTLNKLLELNSASDIIKIGTDALLFPEFAVLTGSAAKGVYLTGPINNSDDYALLLSQWQNSYDQPPSADYHIYAYDAIGILAQAIETVAVLDNRGGMLIGKQALREAIANTQNFDGLTGTISCNAFGDCSAAESIGMYQLNDAQISDSRWPPVTLP